MWYLAVGLAARGWESHNLEIWWNSDSFFVSFEVTLSGSQVPGYILPPLRKHRPDVLKSTFTNKIQPYNLQLHKCTHISRNYT